MVNIARPLTAPIVFASAATLAAVLGFAAFISVGSIPTASQEPVRAVALLVPPTLLAISTALLLRRFQRRDSATPWLFAGFAILGAASVLVFSASFSAGMDDADAGRPIGFLGSITAPVGLTGVALVGAASATLLWTVLAQANRPSRPMKKLIAGAVGLVVGVPAFAALLNPSSVATAGLALVVVLAVLARRDAARADLASVSRPERPGATGSTEQRERAARWARQLGVLALVTIVLVWGIGAAVGISQTGRPIASTAMGMSAAFAQLAAIPLIVAGIMIGSARTPRLAWRRLSPIAIVGSIAGTGVQVAAMTPDGSATFAGAIMAGLSLGAWIAITIAPLVPVTAPARVGIGVAVTLGGGLAWFAFVLGSGGIGLAIPAALLTFGGARTFVGLPADGRVPATPA